MTNKQLCHVSWLPLSEADKSACQVVRRVRNHDIVSMAKYTTGGWIVYPHSRNLEFLCIEPVDNDASFNDWLGEIEGFSMRYERLMQDVKDNPHEAALYWIHAAFVAGAGGKHDG